MHLLLGSLGAAAEACGAGVAKAETAPEIELKFQLAAHGFRTFENTLGRKVRAGTITFKEEVEHEEWYFNNPSNTFWFASDKGFSDAYTTLRVRKTAKKSTFCVKVRHVDTTGKTISRDETEETIKSAEDKIKELRRAGFTDILQFKKTRKKYISGPFELVIDSVSGSTDGKDFIFLGTFIEVEYTEKGVLVEEGMRLIKEFLFKELGLKTVKVIDRSYPHMLKNPAWETQKTWGFWWNEDLETGEIS